MKKLEGKVALVTGAARGIGAAIAERLAADGASVAINYATSKAEAEALAERIRAKGGKAKAIHADISNPSQAKAFVDAAVKEFGRLDILVNNAGTLRIDPIGTIEEADVRSQFAVNVDGQSLRRRPSRPTSPRRVDGSSTSAQSRRHTLSPASRSIPQPRRPSMR